MIKNAVTLFELQLFHNKILKTFKSLRNTGQGKNRFTTVST